MDENKKIGQKIKKARTESRLTQGQLGKIIGRTGSAIGYLEAGLRKIDPDTLKRIADALNKPVQYFYGEEKEDFDIYAKLKSIEKQISELAILIKKKKRK